MLLVRIRGPYIAIIELTNNIKAGSQSDARPYLICVNSQNAQIYFSKSWGPLDDVTEESNTGERKDRIRVYPSVVYKHRREDDATQRNELYQGRS